VGWGVRGKLGGWDSDVSLVYGLNEVAYGVEHSLNTSYGAASQTSFDAGAMKYDQLVFNAGIVRTFDVGNLPEGINVALGIEARQENYSIDAGEPASYNRGPIVGVAAGSQGFPGFQPSNELDEDREAYSAYVDVEAKLTQKLLTSVALRAEDYSDFGSAVTGKVAARYDFTDAFALRGAVSTGFRAPGLQQEFFTSTATNFIAGVPFEVGTFPATSDVAITLGAQPLDAEESVNYSLGTVFRFGGFEATVDAYRIDIDNRIVLSENLNTPQVAALIAPFGATVARFFINGVETKTEGIDLVARYLWRTENVGRFEFIAAGNWNDTEVEKVPSTNVIDNICNGQPAPCTPPVLFARINTLSFEDGTPDNKMVLGVDWNVPLGAAEFGVNLKGTRYGEVIEPGVPTAARAFWAYVDARSGDPDLGAASFLEIAHRKHFYFGIADGVKAGFMHFRQCDQRLNAQGGRKTASAYDAIGAAQVAKASFSGMRLLHRLDGRVAIWPMDPLPATGSAVVEIYTRIFLRRAGMAGSKLRSRAALNLALEGLGSPPSRLPFEPNDHQTDALVTAAGMRALARHEPRAFAPHGLTPEIARSEGWTFGVL